MIVSCFLKHISRRLAVIVGIAAMPICAQQSENGSPPATPQTLSQGVTGASPSNANGHVPPVPPQPYASQQIDAGSQVFDNGSVLLRGPVHEAFAEQYSEKAILGMIVTRRPPEAIDEIPPDAKPLSQAVTWIPGYWGWDEETKDFVWVTGIWRQPPPGRFWVPGYWDPVQEGFQWVSGLWADEQLEQIEYLPAPPESVTATASSPSPGANYFYVPGAWSFRDRQYQWRAGYWAAGNPQWIWVPDCYVWTPNGYIYRSGYWDHQISQRGTLFCPVQFQTSQRVRFQPSYVVNTDFNWLANLFVYPAYRHYYFGDYYATQYRQQNIVPWISYSQNSGGFDPVHSYYATQRRNDLVQVTQLHQRYDQDQRLRPARGLDEQMNRPQTNAGVSTPLLTAVAITALTKNATELRGKGWDLPFAYGQQDNLKAPRSSNNVELMRELQSARITTESTQSRSRNEPGQPAIQLAPGLSLRLPKRIPNGTQNQNPRSQSSNTTPNINGNRPDNQNRSPGFNPNERNSNQNPLNRPTPNNGRPNIELPKSLVPNGLVPSMPPNTQPQTPQPRQPSVQPPQSGKPGGPVDDKKAPRTLPESIIPNGLRPLIDAVPKQNLPKPNSGGSSKDAPSRGEGKGKGKGSDKPK